MFIGYNTWIYIKYTRSSNIQLCWVKLFIYKRRHDVPLSHIFVCLALRYGSLYKAARMRRSDIRLTIQRLFAPVDSQPKVGCKTEEIETNTYNHVPRHSKERKWMPLLLSLQSLRTFIKFISLFKLPHALDLSFLQKIQYFNRTLHLNFAWSFRVFFPSSLFERKDHQKRRKAIQLDFKIQG